VNPALLRTGQWLRRRALNVAALLLATMFTCFLIQIVMRYVFGHPVGWTEELSILCWMWGILWGAAFVVAERDEVRFDIVYGSVSEGVRRVFTVVTGIALIGLYGISLPAAYGFVTFMSVERSAYLRVPISYLYAIYLIFAVACIVRYAWLVWHAIRGGRPADAQPAAPTDRPS
jgi:TRAP-type C4-dicarboxylate transport system permease small subunit